VTGETLRILLLGWMGSAGLMALLWLLQLRTCNAGIVDVGWAFSLGALAVFDALVAPGGAPHRLLVGILGGIWGFRLAWHLLFDRVLGHPEEGRYVTLRKNWGRSADAKLFLFFEAQALLAAILSLPFLIAASRPGDTLGVVELVGAALWIAGIVGESVADRQLARFKRDPYNRGRVCDIGLWRTSRHPNYFFEWVIWCGFAALGLTAQAGWLALSGPAIILFFLLRVTGIPPTEAQSLKSRGEAYREYQRTTSAFVPWFPKRSNR
jgi:steroid 5-alpha reductase family enzyme